MSIRSNQEVLDQIAILILFFTDTKVLSRRGVFSALKLHWCHFKFRVMYLDAERVLSERSLFLRATSR